MHHLDRTRELEINPATGSVMYVEYDVALTE